MNYITLDLEWNQAFGEIMQSVQKRLGCRLRGELIQIGAVKMNEHMVPIGSFSLIIKPIYFQRMSKYVTQLTHIDQFMVDNGYDLIDAATAFKEFCGKDYVLLTWGPDDIPMFEDNLRARGVSSEWLSDWYDLQKIFHIQTKSETKQMSLEGAMEYFQIPETLPAHNALNDAFFTTQIAQKLNVQKGIREYSSMKSKFLLEKELGNADVGQTGFDSEKTIFNLEELAKPLCPICQSKLKVKSHTLHSKGKKYITLFECVNDGPLFQTIHIKENFNETYRAHFEIEKANEETIQDFQTKLKNYETNMENYRKRQNRKKYYASRKNNSQ